MKKDELLLPEPHRERVHHAARVIAEAIVEEKNPFHLIVRMLLEPVFEYVGSLDPDEGKRPEVFINLSDQREGKKAAVRRYWEIVWTRYAHKHKENAALRFIE